MSNPLIIQNTTGNSPDEKRISSAQETQKDRLKINTWAGGALFLGLIVVFSHTGFNPSAATALLWAGACLALGGLLGFLFGIPRARGAIVINNPGVAAVSANVNRVTTSENAPPESRAGTVAGVGAATGTTADKKDTPAKTDPPAAPANDANAQPSQDSRESNLEQVSDWVTKLLLGGSLTQIAAIPAMFTNWGAYVAQGIGNNDASSQTFATALILYFMVLGFIAGYLITKVELGSSLKD